jgi:hypothetical protein
MELCRRSADMPKSASCAAGWCWDVQSCLGLGKMHAGGGSAAGRGFAEPWPFPGAWLCGTMAFSRFDDKGSIGSGSGPAIAPAGAIETQSCAPVAADNTMLFTRKRLSLLASPGDGPASVRRYALTKLLEKKLSSILVASTFDLWRMQMYCRVQHEFCQQAIMQMSMHHQELVHSLEARIADWETGRRLYPRVEPSHQAAGDVLYKEPALEGTMQAGAAYALPLRAQTGDESTLSVGLSELLDQGEAALNAANDRVRHLETECITWRLHNLELQKKLDESQAMCFELKTWASSHQALLQDHLGSFLIDPSDTEEDAHSEGEQVNSSNQLQADAKRPQKRGLSPPLSASVHAYMCAEFGTPQAAKQTAKAVCQVWEELIQEQQVLEDFAVCQVSAERPAATAAATEPSKPKPTDNARPAVTEAPQILNRQRQIFPRNNSPLITRSPFNASTDIIVGTPTKLLAAMSASNAADGEDKENRANGQHVVDAHSSRSTAVLSVENYGKTASPRYRQQLASPRYRQPTASFLAKDLRRAISSESSNPAFERRFSL